MPQYFDRMLKRTLPLLGILSSLALFLLAAAYYPGGSFDPESPSQIVGYDWTYHYISTLYAATALNGAPNTARYIAIPAMLLIATSVAFLFNSISQQTDSSALKKSIHIGGIGSMVYAFLAVVTPMHDLLVTIGLVFFLVAMVAVLWMLRSAHQYGLLWLGALCFAVLLTCGGMYYGNVLGGLLPVMQKVVFVSCAGWLVAVYWVGIKRQILSVA